MFFFKRNPGLVKFSFLIHPKFFGRYMIYELYTVIALKKYVFQLGQAKNSVLATPFHSTIS